MLRAGPFHTALRWAIADRGLSLDRLRDRLTGAGLSVSVATLSNWQRGVSRPDRAESLRVLAELETVLRLPAGSLGRLLDEPAHQGRTRAAVPGTSPVVAQRLRAALDAAAEPGLDVLAVQEDVTVLGPGHWHSTVRVAVRARQAGVRRHVVLTHTQGSVPTVRAGRDCALGRERTDREAGLVATELVFPALGRGEEYALLYHVSGAVAEPYHGMWLRAGQHFDMTLRFGPDTGVERAYRIWRLDPRSPHKDLTRLRLFDARRAHLIDHDVTPGFHGIRWCWPNSGNS
ncbi:hypothetical protein AB0M43_04755 [Longispora sp. NPDC051575]|uniref:hypothetical protein n=1 Tax=Longispora sp. NPDC051575 TaxID=3154943 RepID=UPI0034152439